MSAELILTKARAGYRTIEVLHGLDLTIPAGKVTALLGVNGAGKSTTLRVLAGLLPLRSGSLTWQGRTITTMSALDRARRGLMLVPDERAVFATLTVRENLQVIAEATGHRNITGHARGRTRLSDGMSLQADGKAMADRDIAPALEAFPRLRERLAQRAGTLSGGERRMLALARALLARPKVLLVDELSLGLSPKVAGELFAWLGTVAASGTTVVLADQYTEEALGLADVVYVLHRGECSFVGDPAELKPTVSAEPV